MRDVETLLEALPYIRDFYGKTIVIKYGGAAMQAEDLKQDFARDVVLLKYVGLNPVIVHGGGPDITDYMERLDLNVEFVDGLRVSNEDTVEIARMVLTGKVNAEIVSTINRHGQPAVGLSGQDGLLLEAVKQLGADGRDLGQVGKIQRVDVDLIDHIARDYIPVVAAVGSDREGNSYNVNADEVASAVARALHAYKLIYLTDVPGWLNDANDETSLIRKATVDQVDQALATMQGGMLPKLKSCVEAIQGGVGSAHILDGRTPHTLLLELFTDSGVGTKISPAK